MPEDRTPPTYFGAPPRALSTGTSVVARSAAHARIFAGFVIRTTSAWVRAARRLARLRIERRTLERRRERLQYELGGAAYAEDAERIGSLRADLHACVGEIERNETEKEAALGRARRRTSEERSAAASTQIIPPSE
jgi:hypothetical protein